jgi:hypothetical protein
MRRILGYSSDEDFLFFYLQECDSDSLSFFRLFDSPEVLYSFRSYLESIPFAQRRLIIPFTSSLLRFRFCPTPREYCPLCGRRWLWIHFFCCTKLDIAPDVSARAQVFCDVSEHIKLGHREIFAHYLRFCLLEWTDGLSQVAFPLQVIDDLC